MTMVKSGRGSAVSRGSSSARGSPRNIEEEANQGQAEGLARLYERNYYNTHPGAPPGSYNPAQTIMGGSGESGEQKVRDIVVSKEGYEAGDIIPDKLDRYQQQYSDDGFYYGGEMYYGDAAARKRLQLEETGQDFNEAHGVREAYTVVQSDTPTGMENYQFKNPAAAEAYIGRVEESRTIREKERAIAESFNRIPGQIEPRLTAPQYVPQTEIADQQTSISTTSMARTTTPPTYATAGNTGVISPDSLAWMGIGGLTNAASGATFAAKTGNILKGAGAGLGGYIVYEGTKAITAPIVNTYYKAKDYVAAKIPEGPGREFFNAAAILGPMFPLHYAGKAFRYGTLKASGFDDKTIAQAEKIIVEKTYKAGGPLNAFQAKVTSEAAGIYTGGVAFSALNQAMKAPTAIKNIRTNEKFLSLDKGNKQVISGRGKIKVQEAKTFLKSPIKITNGKVSLQNPAKLAKYSTTDSFTRVALRSSTGKTAGQIREIGEIKLKSGQTITYSSKQPYTINMITKQGDMTVVKGKIGGADFNTGLISKEAKRGAFVYSKSYSNAGAMSKTRGISFVIPEPTKPTAKGFSVLSGNNKQILSVGKKTVYEPVKMGNEMVLKATQREVARASSPIGRGGFDYLKPSVKSASSNTNQALKVFSKTKPQSFNILSAAKPIDIYKLGFSMESAGASSMMAGVSGFKMAKGAVNMLGSRSSSQKIQGGASRLRPPEPTQSASKQTPITKTITTPELKTIQGPRLMTTPRQNQIPAPRQATGQRPSTGTKTRQIARVTQITQPSTFTTFQQVPKPPRGSPPATPGTAALPFLGFAPGGGWGVSKKKRPGRRFKVNNPVKTPGQIKKMKMPAIPKFKLKGKKK